MSLPLHHLFGLAALLSTCWSLTLATGAARAAVAFKAATCAQSSSVTTLSIPVPAGTASGDLIVASVGIAHSASVATPSGWTQVPNLRGTVSADQEMVTWYRMATASEPASYTFTAGSGTDTIAGGLSTYSGANPASPIAAGAAQTIQSSLTTSDTLPNATGTLAGSIRYSAATSDDMTTSTYQANLSKVCDETNETGVDIATSIAWEATGAGTTATRTVSRSDNAHSVLHTMVISPPPCGTGTLGFTPDSAVAFPTTVLNGLDRTIAASGTMDVNVNDQSSAHSGWSLSATSTTFTSGSWTLPTTATRITGVGATAGSGNCSMPTNAITYPVTLPAGPTAPAAAKIYNAASGTGAGPVDLAASLSLALPASTHVGTYNSTWTLTLATGP